MQAMAPLMFAGLVFIMLIGFPVAFSLAALGLGFGFLAIELGYFPAQFHGQPAASDLRHHVERLCSRSRSSPSWARFSSDAAWRKTCSRAPGQLFGSVPGGLAYAVIIVGAMLGAITGTVAGLGDRDGRDLAADHAALRLQPAHRDRRHRRVGHDHAADPAFAGADRPGRPARTLGRRHVQGRDRPVDRAGAALSGVHLRWCRSSARRCVPPLPTRSAHVARLAVVAHACCGAWCLRSC